MATGDNLLAPISLNKNAQFFHLSEHFKDYIADSVSQAFIGYLNNYLINVIADGSITLKVNSSDICQKCSDCLSICKSINNNSNAVDFFDDSACPVTVLDLLWQIVRIQIMDNINENRFPELTYLIQEGEDVRSFSLTSPEDILLRWLNYHLRKAGSCRIAKNFTTDLSDSEIYRVVINGLNPAVCKPMQGKEADHMKQASHAIKPSDIYDANEKLNMIFVAQLFNASNSLPKNEDNDSGVRMTKIQELSVQNSPVQENEHEPNWRAIAEELLAEKAAKAAEIESLRQRIESLQQDLAIKSQGNCNPTTNASNKLLSQRYKYFAPKWSPQKMAQPRIATNLLNADCARSDYEKDNAHSQPHIFRSARDLRVESDSLVTSFFFCDIDTNTLCDEHSSESYESSKHKLKFDREEEESDSRDSISTVTNLQMLDSELSHAVAGDDESHEVYFAMKKADMLFLLREYNSRRLTLRSTISQDLTTKHGDDDSSTYSDVVECEKDFLSGVESSSSSSSSSWKTEVASYAEKIVCSPVSFDCGSVDTDDYVYDTHGALEFNKQFVEEDDIQVYDWEFWEVEDRNRTYLSDTIIFHQASEICTDEESLDITDELLESPIDGSVCVFDDIAIDTYSIADSYSCRDDDDDFDDDYFVYDGDDDGLTGRYPDCEELQEFGCGGQAFISVDDLAPTYDAPLSSSTAPIDLPTTEDIGCAKADEAVKAYTYIQSRYHIHHHWLLFSIAACFISVCCWVLFFPSVVNLTKQGDSQTSITDTVKNTTGVPTVPSTSLISLPAAVIVRNITVKVLFVPIASRSTGPAHTFIHQLLKFAIKIFCGMPEEHIHLLGLH